RQCDRFLAARASSLAITQPFRDRGHPQESLESAPSPEPILRQEAIEDRCSGIQAPCMDQRLRKDQQQIRRGPVPGQVERTLEILDRRRERTGGMRFVPKRLEQASRLLVPDQAASKGVASGL